MTLKLEHAGVVARLDGFTSVPLRVRALKLEATENPVLSDVSENYVGRIVVAKLLHPYSPLAVREYALHGISEDVREPQPSNWPGIVQDFLEV